MKKLKPPNFGNPNLDGFTALRRNSVSPVYRKIRKLVRKILLPIRVIRAIIFIHGFLKLVPKFFERVEILLQTVPWF